MEPFNNPFRPGAGQLPPYLAGRAKEIDYFEQTTLAQKPILKNLIISGLRGVGKTVLLDTLKPKALEKGWIWAGADMSESVSVSERNLATRIITDLASAVSHILVTEEIKREIGFQATNQRVKHFMSNELLNHIYNTTPGLESDKLKAVLNFVWRFAESESSGIVLAYDEAQNLKDDPQNKQYPLSLLLEIIQSIQKTGIPYLLILTGLPTLFPNLIESRTYAERMFHQMILQRLQEKESRDAIEMPIKEASCPVHLTDSAIEEIIRYSGGYPYFIQYICKETYDSYLQQISRKIENPSVSFDDVMRKLDTDFYQGRWNRVTDRQRNLLNIIAGLPSAEEEFTLKEIQQASQKTETTLKVSAINIMLKALADSGLIYKNRHGKYSFAVPMFSHFIKREIAE